MSKKFDDFIRESRNKRPAMKEIFNILIKNGLTRKTRSGLDVEIPEIFIAADLEKRGVHRIWYQSHNPEEWQEKTEMLKALFEGKDFAKVEPARKPQKAGPRS